MMSFTRWIHVVAADGYVCITKLGDAAVLGAGQAEPFKLFSIEIDCVKDDALAVGVVYCFADREDGITHGFSFLLSRSRMDKSSSSHQ